MLPAEMSVIPSSAPKMRVNTVASAFPWVTTSSVFVPLDFQEDVAKLTLTNVRHSRVITVVLASICLRVIDVNALPVMPALTAKRKGQIVGMIHVQNVPCVKMSPVIITILVCVDLVILEETATLRYFLLCNFLSILFHYSFSD